MSFRTHRVVLALAFCQAAPACTDDDPSATTADASTSSSAGDTTMSSTAPTTTSPTGDDTIGDSSTSDAATTDAPTSGTGDGTTTGGPACGPELAAIVTDIDETLTTSDGEFLLQLGDGNYDPEEREGGAAMITAYADLGYRIMYLTARSETLGAANTGESARELTERWLNEHGYPMDPATTIVVLSPVLVAGPSTADYKTEALEVQQAEGWRFDYAYGNADTDITAYANVGIALEHTFIIGEQAGNGGTVAIEGEDWLDHSAEFLPTVPLACPE